MSAARAVVVHPSADALFTATAARFLLAVLDAQSVRHPVHVAVAGGSVGTEVLGRVAQSPLRATVDWTGVHVWWVDERFVPAGHADRNDEQARPALEALGLPPANLHPMPAPDGGGSLADGALAYARELAEHAPDGGTSPTFDVVVLGMGPDGHIASLFPGRDTVAVTDRPTVVEADSPKPPPERISLTVPVINDAHQVWLVAAGDGKADAVAGALAGATPAEVPAVAAAGRDVTLWLLDAAAAGR